jgi:hypothetical protein
MKLNIWIQNSDAILTAQRQSSQERYPTKRLPFVADLIAGWHQKPWK